MARLFIAVDIPQRIKDDIVSTYLAIPGAKWVKEDQLHITLRFLGEPDAVTEEKIIFALNTISFPPFCIALKGCGYFPPRREPRILWIGINDQKNVTALQGKIERLLISAGISPDKRRFHPHVTISRLNNSPVNRVIDYLTNYSLFQSEPFYINEFCLYSSILRKEGACYTKEATFKLSNP